MVIDIIKILEQKCLMHSGRKVLLLMGKHGAKKKKGRNHTFSFAGRTKRRYSRAGSAPPFSHDNYIRMVCTFRSALELDNCGFLVTLILMTSVVT